MPPPDPACSKVRHGSRTRSGSAPGTSHTSRATAALNAERKSRREATLAANRFAALRDMEQGDEDQSPICVGSDEPEEDSSNMEREKPPLKRRMVKEEDGEEPSSSEETRGKRGRPQTTGLYVGRADAIERENRMKREALELDMEKSIMSLSASQVRSTHDASVIDKLEELENAPTEDVALRARESMIKVWKVATSSKNLKGNSVKLLKQAAAVGTASAEVLSNRADNNEPDGEALRQIKALRRELELTKREVQSAKEEAERAKRESGRS